MDKTKIKLFKMIKSLSTILMILILQSSMAQTRRLTGFYDKNIDKELSLESAFDKNLSKADVGETIRKFPKNRITWVL